MFNRIAAMVYFCFSLTGATFASAQGLQDPTRPLTELNTSRPGSISIVRSGLQLDSILISPTRRVAVINGRSLVVGDFLDEIEVTDIQVNGVEVLQQGRRYLLKPQPGAVDAVKRRS